MRERWCASDRGLVPWTVKVRKVGSREVKFKACNWCDRPTQASKPKASKPIRKRVTLGAKRARVKAEGTLDDFQWLEICRVYGGLCAWCLKNPATQQDHVIPIARGGTHTAGNVVPCCESCQYEKGTSRKYVLPAQHPFKAHTDVSGEPIPERIPESEIPH